MVDYVVSRATSNEELSRLVQDDRSDKTLRFRAAEKLLEREDLKRSAGRVKRLPSNFGEYLREKQQRKQMDWKNRGLEAADFSKTAARKSSITLPKLVGLPNFAAREESKAAKIAAELMIKQKVSGLDASGQEPARPESHDEFYRSLKEARSGDPAKGKANGGYDVVEDGVDLARERTHRIQKNIAEQLRDLDRSRLTTTEEDEDNRVQIGGRFFRWIYAREPQLGSFLPDTLVFDPNHKNVTVFLNSKGNARRTTERTQVQVDKLGTPEFFDAWFSSFRNTKREDGPQYVVKTTGPCAQGPQEVRLLFSEEEAKEILGQLARSPPVESCVVLQRFVKSSGKRPTLYRITYNAVGARFQVYTLSSKKSFPDNWTSDTSEDPSWLVLTRANQPDYMICSVEGNMVTNNAAKGDFERPFQIIKGVLNDLSRFSAVRFRSTCFEFIKDAKGAWFLTQVRGFQGLQIPESLRICKFPQLLYSEPEPVGCTVPDLILDQLADDKQLHIPSEKSDTLDPVSRKKHSCSGDYCSTSTSCDKITKIAFCAILFDRYMQDSLRVKDFISKVEPRSLLEEASVCSACCRVYKSRARMLDTDGPVSPQPVVLEFLQALEQRKRESYGVSATRSEDSSSGVAIVRSSSNSKLSQSGYSRNMLELNRSIYDRMIRAQKRERSRREVSRAIPPAVAITAAGAALPADMLLPSPDVDFDLFPVDAAQR